MGVQLERTQKYTPIAHDDSHRIGSCLFIRDCVRRTGMLRMPWRPELGRSQARGFPGSHCLNRRLPGESPYAPANEGRFGRFRALRRMPPGKPRLYVRSPGRKNKACGKHQCFRCPSGVRQSYIHVPWLDLGLSANLPPRPRQLFQRQLPFRNPDTCLGIRIANLH